MPRLCISNVSLIRVIFQNNNSVARSSIQSSLFNISNEFPKFYERRSFVRIISSLVSRALGPGLGSRESGIKSMIVFLFKACMELDLGLDEDDWNSIAGNLLKDFNKNIRNVAINNVENSVNLGDFLSELQSLRDEKKRRNPKDDNSVSDTCEHNC